MTSKILTYLSKETTVISTGFGAGLVFTIFRDQQMCLKLNNKHVNNTEKKVGTKFDISKMEILKNPLSTLCEGFINGMFPYSYRPLIPICLGFSVINSAHKYFRDENE